MTTACVATNGGHLRQLDQLATRFRVPTDTAPGAGLDPTDTVWVTSRDQQSVSLLAGRNVRYVPEVAPRDVAGVVRRLPDARRLMRSHPIRLAISTGSALALGYLPYLAARGVQCHYVESATRVIGPSLTGRLLSRVPGIRLYCQYPSWADRRWRYAGNIFDNFEADPKPPGRAEGPLRVVVTLGIGTGFPFRGLVQRLVPLLARGGPLSVATGREVSVTWQTLGTPTDGLPIEVVDTLPLRELTARLTAADLVISHAGVGSAVGALEQGRYPLLVPRRPQRGEIGDDHQVQLAAELERRGLALAREADALTVDDMLEVLDRRVRPASSPPPIELRT